MEKEELRKKIQQVREKYTNMKPENKKLLFYSTLGFIFGLGLGYLLKKRSR